MAGAHVYAFVCIHVCVWCVVLFGNCNLATSFWHIDATPGKSEKGSCDAQLVFKSINQLHQLCQGLNWHVLRMLLLLLPSGVLYSLCHNRHNPNQITTSGEWAVRYTQTHSHTYSLSTAVKVFFFLQEKLVNNDTVHKVAFSLKGNCIYIHNGCHESNFISICNLPFVTRFA